MEITEELMTRTEIIQRECQEYADKIIKMSPDISYTSLAAIWTYTKLAALELRIEKLEEAESDRELVRQGY